MKKWKLKTSALIILIILAVVGAVYIIIEQKLNPDAKLYPEYTTDSFNIFKEVLEFQLEVQKCYGLPGKYDPIYQHNVYSGSTFYHDPRINDLGIDKLLAKLHTFLNKYSNREERYFWS